MSSYHHGNLRAALVEAAVALARDRGPEGVVLREVARRTGVSHNAAYRHFADRDALLAEVGRIAMAQLAQAMRARLAAVRTRDPVDRARRRLREVGRAYVHFALAEPGIFEVAFAGLGGPPAPEEKPEPGPYDLLNETLDELVAAGATTTELRDGAELTCWAAVHGFALLHLQGPMRSVPPQEREASLQVVLDHVLRAVS